MSKLEKIADKMMNELYTNSTPRITWKQFVKKYKDTKIRGYEKHTISQEKCEAILDKYVKKVPKMYRSSLRMLWLDLAPKNSKVKK
jgi:translation initiation factor RLI1